MLCITGTIAEPHNRYLAGNTVERPADNQFACPTTVRPLIAIVLYYSIVGLGILDFWDIGMIGRVEHSISKVT